MTDPVRSTLCNLCLLLLTATTITATSINAAASEPAEVFDLWPDTPPGPARNIGQEKDTSTATSRTVAERPVIRLGNVSTPQVHVYLPPKGKSNGSSVVICPGGGFSILAWDLEGTEVAEWLTTQGVTAFVLKYRVPTRMVDPIWLQPTQDAQRAISLIRSRSKDWGIDDSRVGILGFSAGGHTAARATLTKKRLYDPVDAADQQPFRPNASMLIYAAYLTNKDNTQLAEDLVVDETTPPVFMVHAFDDRVPAQGPMLLGLALKQAGIASELHVYDTGGHGYGLRPVEGLPVTSWPDRCSDWLSRIGWK
ncbi:MAG: alpha/beta hydrolase [Planctomycetaceae bacterium]|nr:alpha/beta hydrolase [Planctomycetaceae bacterium]